MKLDGKLQRQFTTLALHRFDNVSEPPIATIAFLAQAEKRMPTREATLQDAETGTRVYLRFRRKKPKWLALLQKPRVLMKNLPLM